MFQALKACLGGWLREGVPTFLAPFFSGLMLGLLFKRPDWSCLAWIALAPMAAVLWRRSRRAELYLGAFFGGLEFHLLGMEFLCSGAIAPMDESWLCLGYLLAPSLLLTVWLGRVLVQRLGLPAAIAFPAAWVAMEFTRRHLFALPFEFCFPFLELGTASIDQIHIVQIADLFGVAGSSWLIASANGALADAIHFLRTPGGLRRIAISFALAGFPLTAAYAYGSWRLSSTTERTGPTVAIMPGQWASGPVDEAAVHIREQINAARGNAAPDSFPDLLIWCEESYGHFVKLPQNAESENTYLHGSGAEEIGDLAAKLRAAIVVGAIRQAPEQQEPHYFNSLLFFTSNGDYAGCYDKLRLATCGEFQPRIGRYLSDLTGTLILHPSEFGRLEYHPGEHRPTFGLEMRNGQTDYVFAATICYDLWFSEVFQSYLTPRPGGQNPEFFVNIAYEGTTNDIAYSRRALRIARFRAIESGRMIVRCCGEGYSAMIDSRGSVQELQGAPDAAKSVIVAKVSISRRQTLYSLTGDLFPLLITIFLGLLLLRRALGILRSCLDTKEDRSVSASLLQTSSGVV